MAVASGRAFAEIYTILTPDQQTKLKSLQAQMQQRGQQSRASPAVGCRADRLAADDRAHGRNDVIG